MVLTRAALAWLLLLAVSEASVTVLYPSGADVSLDSTEAKFGPDLADGLVGQLVVVSPLDGCTALAKQNATMPSVALIQRGTCEFGTKVKNAQTAGFLAVIVFDDIPEELITMYSEEPSISIPSVFVSQDSGTVLLQAPNGTRVQLVVETTEFPPYLITFITITAAAIFIFTLFMFYRYRTLMRRAALERAVPQTRAVSLEAVKFEDVTNRDVTQCCVCLEDFQPDALVATLRCKHVFHKTCIENWLSRDTRATCPLCKQDPLAAPAAAAECNTVTERTPLLNETA